MRVYSYGDRIKKHPFIINKEFSYAAFSCELSYGKSDMEYLTEVAKAVYAHYIEALRIADMCANKQLPKAVLSGVRNAQTLMCRTRWLSTQLAEYTKEHPEHNAIWTTSRMLIAPRAIRIEYFRATKLLIEADKARLAATASGKTLGYNILRDVNVANITEFYRFDETAWQIPVTYTNTVVINADGRKHHGEPKGRGAAIFSSESDSYLYLPKRKEPYHIKKNSITGDKVLDCKVIPGIDLDKYNAYVTRIKDKLYFHIIFKGLEFRRFTEKSYFDWKEPHIDRIPLHGGIYANVKNGVLIPNERIPDKYRSRCGLE